MLPEKGIYWLIEGVGGAGKTAVAAWMLGYLRSLGRDVEETREPGGVKAAEDLRDLIFKLKETNSANADNLAALFMASRYFLIKEFIKPKLTEGIDVIGVRGFPSTAVYQVIDGSIIETIDKMAEVVMGDTRPDAVLLLDLEGETAYQRKHKNDDGDPFDRQGVKHFEQVVAHYRELSRIGWGNMIWHKIHAEKSFEDVCFMTKKVIDAVIRESSTT